MGRSKGGCNQNHSLLCEDIAAAECWFLQLVLVTQFALHLDSELSILLLEPATVSRSQMMLPSFLLLERILQCPCLYSSFAIDTNFQSETSNSLSLGHVPMLPSLLLGELEKLSFSAFKIGSAFCPQQDS